jgi:hypothetical protein
MTRRDEDLDLNEEAEMSRLESGEPEDEPPPEPVRVLAPAIGGEMVILVQNAHACL